MLYTEQNDVDFKYIFTNLQEQWAVTLLYNISLF